MPYYKVLYKTEADADGRLVPLGQYSNRDDALLQARNVGIGDFTLEETSNFLPDYNLIEQEVLNGPSEMYPLYSRAKSVPETRGEHIQRAQTYSTDDAAAEVARATAELRRRSIAATQSSVLASSENGSVMGGEGAVAANGEVMKIVEFTGRADASFNASLKERPADIRDAARALAAAVREQLNELKASSEGVNDRADIDSFLDFLAMLETGLNNLADALDRLIEAKGANEPIFTEQARNIARGLADSVATFVESHSYVSEISIKVGLAAASYKFLLICGLNETAVGVILTAIIASTKK